MASSRPSWLRARSEASREGAKPRSSDERRTILATPFRDVLRGRAPVGRAQAQADASVVQVGADVTKVVPASAEKAIAVVAEPPKVEPVAPAVGPLPEATAAESQPGSATKPRKRGRPKKVESEGKAEAKPGKRQKSLFDF